MPSSVVSVVLIGILAVLSCIVLFVAYVWIRYAPIIGRIFEDAPVFRPLRAEAPADGENVRFPTADGLSLAGSYYRHRTTSRAGVVVFCHEFLGDRASVGPYAQSLRDIGFDLFAFDFRNHGESDAEAGYQPLQWVSNRETRDLKAALVYLRKRPDADSAGVALFGVSRGGSTALCVAGRDPRVWAVVTDGAFPTRGTMLAYILRWADIYVGSRSIYSKMPICLFKSVTWAARVRTEWTRKRRFPDVETATRKLSPRPLLMIHGEKDSYIGPDIAKTLFAEAGQPKELWMVAGAKHNSSRNVDPETYRTRLEAFFRRFAPRRVEVAPASSGSSEDQDVAMVVSQ